MTPIEQELSEIESNAKWFSEGSIDKSIVEGTLHEQSQLVVKLISFIRHQREIIEKKDGALTNYSNLTLEIDEDTDTAYVVRHGIRTIPVYPGEIWCVGYEAAKALAIKARESLEADDETKL